MSFPHCEAKRDLVLSDSDTLLYHVRNVLTSSTIASMQMYDLYTALTEPMYVSLKNHAVHQMPNSGFLVKCKVKVDRGAEADTVL